MIGETHRPVLSRSSLNRADNAMQRERIWVEMCADAWLQRDDTDTRYRPGDGILHLRGKQHIAKRGHTSKGAPAELKNKSKDGHKQAQIHAGLVAQNAPQDVENGAVPAVVSK